MALIVQCCQVCLGCDANMELAISDDLLAFLKAG
jgi:hypothetical protein